MVAEAVPPHNDCRLLGTFGIALQVGMGLLSFSMLLLKRKYEYPKRSLKIFSLDISKQAISQGW